jgi:hypothetical protein
MMLLLRRIVKWQIVGLSGWIFFSSKLYREKLYVSAYLAFLLDKKWFITRMM